jgi:uncharacterized protein YkwD
MRHSVKTLQSVIHITDFQSIFHKMDPAPKGLPDKFARAYGEPPENNERDVVMKFLKLIQMLLFSLAFSAATAMTQNPVALKTEQAGPDTLAKQIHRNINTKRKSLGLNALRWNEELAHEARRHAASMAKGRFLSHVDPRRGNLWERLDSAGVAWSKCSENIYKERGILDPAADVVAAWLNSPSHRKNMLDLWMVEAGVGVATQPDGSILVVQVYMYPIPVSEL